MSTTKNTPTTVLPRPEVGATGAAGPGLPPVAEPGRSTSTGELPRRRSGRLTLTVADALHELREQKRNELAHEDVGRASLALIFPVLFAAGLLLIAAASGNLRHLVERIPVNTHPNGFALLVLLLLVVLSWRRVLIRRRAAAYELEAIASNYDYTSPVAQACAAEPIETRRSYAFGALSTAVAFPYAHDLPVLARELRIACGSVVTW